MWLEKAAQVYERLEGEWKSVRPSLAHVYLDIGRMKLNIERREAIAWFQKAVAIFRQLCVEHPDVPAYIDELIGCLWWVGKSHAMLDEEQLALDYYNEILAMRPDNVRTLHDRAHVHWAQKEYGRALEGFEHALRLRPGSSESLNCCAYLLATEPNAPFHDPARAVAMARQSLEDRGARVDDDETWDPVAAYRWNTLGVCYFHADNWREAIEALMQCQRDRVESDARVANLLYLSLSHSHLGNESEALHWLLQAREQIKTHPLDDEELRQLERTAAKRLENRESQETAGAKVPDP